MNLPLPPVKVFLITLFPASFARLGWPTKVALGPASGRTSAKSRASSWPTHYFFSGVGTAGGTADVGLALLEGVVCEEKPPRRSKMLPVTRRVDV